MKRQVYVTISVLVLVALSTMSAKAQSATQPSFAKIPFAFSAGNRILPAGKYLVSITNPVSDQKIVKLTNLATHETAMLQMHLKNGKADGDARLIFNRYGEQFFLAEVWTAADGIGMEASRSRVELAARKELAPGIRQTEAVALKRN